MRAAPLYNAAPRRASPAVRCAARVLDTLMFALFHLHRIVDVQRRHFAGKLCADADVDPDAGDEAPPAPPVSLDSRSGEPEPEPRAYFAPPPISGDFPATTLNTSPSASK